MINLNQLRVFHGAAQNMNSTAAAKTLCITQPAVTAHINSKTFLKKGTENSSH